MPAPGGVNANLFALLDDDDDDNETKAPAQKQQAKPEADKKGPAKERAPKKEGGKGGERRPRNNRSDDNAAPYDGADKPQKPGDGEGRKGGRRRDEEGGGRKGRKGGGKGERFDRRSASGRGKGEAREGRGKYNWGDKTEGAEDAPKEEAAEPAAEAAEGEDAAPAPVEEEENTMSLEEYMKQQKAATASLPKFNERKVADDGSGFKVSRKEYDDDDVDDLIFHAYDGKAKKKGQKEAREGWTNADNVLKISFVESVVDEPARKGGGGKGDRNDSRKGGKAASSKGGKGDGKQQGRGPKSGSKSGGFNADLSNDAAFPTLG